MTRRNVRKQGWVFPLFSPDSDDRLTLNFHRFVIRYISCDTQSLGLGQHCYRKCPLALMELFFYFISFCKLSQGESEMLCIAQFITYGRWVVRTSRGRGATESCEISSCRRNLDNGSGGRRSLAGKHIVRDG